MNLTMKKYWIIVILACVIIGAIIINDINNTGEYPLRNIWGIIMAVCYVLIWYVLCFGKR